MTSKKRLEMAIENFDFDDFWSILGPISCQALNYSKIDQKVYEKGHSCIYDLFLSSSCASERFYEETTKLLQTHIESLHNQMTTDSEDNRSHQAILLRYHKHWSVFQKGFECFNDIYSYANQCSKRENCLFSVGESGFQTTNDLGRHLWKVRMILPIRNELFAAVLDAINQLRDKNQNTLESRIIKKVIESFFFVEDNNVFYKEAFEPLLLEATSEYYRREALRVVESRDKTDQQIFLDGSRVLKSLLPPELHDEIHRKCQHSFDSVLIEQGSITTIRRS